MTEKQFTTPKGTIHYWTNSIVEGRENVVLLPGLTADHRLFDKQVECLQQECNLLVWDAPGHAASRPFQLDFTLEDKAAWLHAILQREKMDSPCLVGQSMGGYVSQAYMQMYPGEVGGFVSIDSAPLQRSYYTAAELWLLKHVETIYRAYPWRLLVTSGAWGCAESRYGRQLMRDIMEVYDSGYYSSLVGHGYRMLAAAVERNLPYSLADRTMLLCGEKDKAGSTRYYNRRWGRRTGLPIHWIEGAGHNSNTDNPEQVNGLLLRFVKRQPVPEL